MQITSYNSQTLSLSLLAKVKADAAAYDDGTASSDTTTQTSATSNPAKSAFAATLAVHSLSTQQTIAGLPSPALDAALAHGAVNPAQWLSSSDISLFEQTTGGTIKDGVVYDKNGNVNSDTSNSDLVNALFEMRNFGTFSANGQPQMVQGAITANDLRGFINHYQKDSGAFNMTILDNALGTLTAQQA